MAEDVIAWCSHGDVAMGVVVAADATAFVASVFFQIFLSNDGKMRSHCKRGRKYTTMRTCATVGKKRRCAMELWSLDTV